MTGILLAFALVGQGSASPGYLPAAAPPATSPATADAFYIFLRHYDQNGDGVLSSIEVPDELIGSFSKTDLNNDGVLDAGELLTAKTKIGRLARKAEGLRLTLGGQLKERGLFNNSSGGDSKLRNALNLINQLDADRDGTLAAQEIPSVVAPTQASEPLQTEFVPLGPPTVTQNTVPTTPPATGAFEKVRPQQALDSPPAAMAQVEQGRSEFPPLQKQPVVPPPAQAKPKASNSDGYPEPEEIIANLDNNGNGMVDRAEAVDQLADRFDSIDKDRNNALDLKELERALRLARLFGIKPKIDPNKYRK